MLCKRDYFAVIITIDSMGCQRHMAKQIIETGANQLLAVKYKPTLLEEIEVSR